MHYIVDYQYFLVYNISCLYYFMSIFGRNEIIKIRKLVMNVTELQSYINTAEQEKGLQEMVYSLVNRFLAENKGKSIEDLHDMILAEVEPPLLQAVMEKKRGNQLQAAKMLGISRGTIRKKLLRYFGTKYFRLTEE